MPNNIKQQLTEDLNQPKNPSETFSIEINTNTPEVLESPEKAVIEPLANRGVLYDAWDRPVETELFVVESINYPDLVAKVIHAGTLGAKLNPTKRIMINAWPYRVHLMIPKGGVEVYESGNLYPFFDENQQYHKVTVRAFSQQRFFEILLDVAKLGVVLEPSTAIVKSPKFSVKLLTRAPIASNQNIITGVEKVTYTKEELSFFDIKQLTIVGSWYNIAVKSKSKYVELILKAQDEYKTS